MNQTASMEESILEAAEKLFLKKGFAATSTTEIAREAGCNQALVHYYFRKKDRLFEAIFQKKASYFVSNLLQISQSNLPFEEKLAKKIETHFEFIQRNPKLPLFFFGELSTNPDRLAAMREKFSELPKSAVEGFRRELEEAVSNGTVRPTNVLDLLMTIVSLNVTVFIAEPIFKIISNMDDQSYQQFLEQRKKENVKIILNSLRP